MGENKMYKVVLMANDLKKFVKFLTELETEAKVELTEHGIHSRIVDPANAAMLDLTLNKNAFFEYNVGDGNTVIGIDLEKINKVISSAGKLSEVTFEEVDGKTKISFDGMEFEVKLLAPDTMKQMCRMPNINFTTVCVIDSIFMKSVMAGVKSIVGDDKISSGYVVIATQGDTMTFISESNEGDKFRFPIQVGGNNEKAESMYSFGYFKTVGLLEGDIEISYGNELPSVYKNTMGEMSVTYMIAPRISGDN
jgi:DNA polymerase III sliding clamp (beta) subunit (PCNA family)